MSYIDPPGKLHYHADRILAIQRGEIVAPINIEIDLSNRCSLGCEGCHFAYTHSRGPLAHSVKPDGSVSTGDLMDTQLIKRVLMECVYAGVRSITWTGGGEPTLHPKFDEIIGYNPIPQGIYTNGVHIVSDRAELMKDKMTWVYISLDYADRAKYQLHKKTDAFDRVISGIKHLRTAQGNATIGIGFLLWKENWRDTAAMIHLGRDLGADYVQFRPMIWFDLNNPGVVAEDTAWMDELIPQLEYWKGAPDVIVDVDRFRNYQHWAGHNYPVCWWSRLQAVITPDGSLWTCVNRRGMDGDCLGNLHDEEFMSIWARHKEKEVDSRCRALCRGHIPNLTLNELAKPLRGHKLFV